MFMFVVSLLAMSIAGLYAQIVKAILALCLSQQIALGQQFLQWHSYAYAFSCSAAGQSMSAASPVAIHVDDLNLSAELRSASSFKSGMFMGTANGTARRLLITYINPGDTVAGYSATDIGSQFSKLMLREHMKYSRVNAGSLVQYVYDGTQISTMTFAGLPMAAGGDVDVDDGAVAIVSDVTCH